MRNRTTRVVVAAALALATAGCGSADPTTSEDSPDIASEEIAALERELDQTKALLAEATTERDSAAAHARAIAAVEANETAYIEAWQAQDLDALMETFTDDILFVDETFGDRINGKDSVKRMYSHVIRFGDPDGRDVFDRFVSHDGTLAASTWEWIGTNGFGKRMDLPTALIHEYHDGKIIKETVYYASPNAYSQLMGS